MDLSKYLAVLVVLLADGGESGGHGGKHHDHVKLHVPEFIHHNHHTNVITIHHHHHKPKEKHHHHHHHHHKPHVPHGHHYHHVKKVHHKKTESSGHHGHHGSHGHHGNHGHHGHHGHHHKHHGHHGGHHHHESPSYYPHHDAPSISYDPTPTSFEDDFATHYSPAVPAYGAGIVPRTPQVHGVTHTIKQVKVFDSLPNGIPSITNGHAAGGGGYQVTEEGEDEDDAFTAIDGLQQSYPATFGYVRGAAPEPVSNDVFSSLSPQSTVQSVNHDPFAESPTPTAFSGNDFTSPAQVPLSSLAPVQNVIPSVQSTPEFPVTFQAEQTGFDDPANAFAHAHAGSTAAALSPEDKAINDIVSYSRVAGIQQTFNTGGVETVVY